MRFFRFIAVFMLASLLLTSCGTSSKIDTVETSPSDSGSNTVSDDAGGDASTASDTTAAVTEETAAETSAADAVAELLASMTIEEKVGQMFLARCPVTGGVEAIGQYHFGGIVMFAANFDGKTSEDTIAETASYQSASKIPLLIAVDEEGGTVTRISRFTSYRSSKFLSPRELYAQGGFELIKSDTAEKCELLLSLGVNVNLAPVCDISTNLDDFMYYRSLGQDAATTSEYVTDVVNVMNGYKVGCSLKHFPGYGSNGDTHTDIITDTRDYSVFEQSDFLPFSAGIEAGAGSVMVSHNIVTCIDADYPASLSAKMHKVLRDTLGFDGVITTDDLSMSAITLYTDGSSAAVAAVEAGNDMLCCSDYITQYAAVLDAVQNGRITEERIDESVTRILKWKQSLGLLG